MDSTPDTAIQPPAVTGEAEVRATKVRRFSSGVSIVMMVVCNAVFLFGIWVTGVNFERLVRTPDRYSAHNTTSVSDWRTAIFPVPPIPCNSARSGSISLIPPGKPTRLRKRRRSSKGPTESSISTMVRSVDYRFFAVVAFVIAILVCGIVLKRHLVNRYRIRLETAAQRAAPIP